VVPLTELFRKIAPGAPARTSRKTASTNNRLSAPCRPLSPFLPGISGSIRRHSPSVTPAESRSPSPVATLNHIRESAGIPLMSTGPSRISTGKSGDEVE
jgi:hypothetical protein